MLATLSASTAGFTGPAAPTANAGRVAAPRMESVADLKSLAKDLNPLLGPHAARTTDAPTHAK